MEQEQVSLHKACELFGYSRQAYYKRKKLTRQYQQQYALVVKLAQEQRIKMPHLGTRKLYHLLEVEFEKQQLKVGRVKLFAVLRVNHLLIKPKKSYHKTTDSKHWLKKHPNLILDRPVTASEQV